MAKRCNNCGFSNSDAVTSCEKCDAPLAGSASTGSRGHRKITAQAYRVPEPFHLDTGSIIEGKEQDYVVEKYIGEGGFAQVYHVKNGTQDYAVKILRLWKESPKEAKELANKFTTREYVTGQLASEHIVRSHDLGFLNGNPFIVMDYCPEGTLHNRIQKGMNEAEITEVSIGILSGLRDLHREGIIHRDLKPDNVLFDKNNQAKLADFGIAAAINNRLTRTNWKNEVKEVWGTVQYMPLEHLEESVRLNATRPTQDIFAFGVMVYEMWTGGKFPYGSLEDYGSNPKKYLAVLKQGHWHDVRQFRPDIPEKWCQIIRRSIEPQLENRFQKTEDILQILHANRPIAQHFAPQNPSNLLGEWVLRIMDGEDRGRIFNLTKLSNNKHKRILTLGWFDTEDPLSNDIGLVEKETNWISSRHATIEWRTLSDNSKQWFIRDGQWFNKLGTLGWHESKNGVVINSADISPDGAMLKLFDIVTIGETKLRFEQV
jgi:serine/threonine protein kinase